MKNPYYIAAIVLSANIAATTPTYGDAAPKEESLFSILSSEKMMTDDEDCRGVQVQITISHINNQKLHKDSITNGEFSAKGWEILIAGVCKVSGHESCTKKALDYQTAFLIEAAIAPGKQYMLVPDPTQEFTRCEVKLVDKP